MPKDHVPKDANVIDGRFVHTIKNCGTANQIYRLVSSRKGHTDREKDYFLLLSTTLHHYSILLVVSIPAMFGFRICTHEVTQAYLHSTEMITRDV